MKLYHATKIENKESIVNYGLIPADFTGNKLNEAGVYGFDNINDARDFATYDKNLEDQYIIISFECDNVAIDPEYTGNAYVTHDIVRNIEIAETGTEYYK
jgi:hypothetical protein